MRLPEHRYRQRMGMTLVEVMTAMALLTIVMGGLVACGSAAMRMADLIRLTTEARGLAKMRMEAVAGATRANLALSDYEVLRSVTNTSTIGDPIVVKTRIIWHTVLGTEGTAASNDYAEVHIEALYDSPLTHKPLVNTLSRLVH